MTTNESPPTTTTKEHSQNDGIVRFRVAIVGAGITGACAASVLTSAVGGGRRQQPQSDSEKDSDNDNDNGDDGPPTFRVEVDLFDQGRSGPGGRASRRVTDVDGPTPRSCLIWDHGCQFFRADTPRMAALVKEWTVAGYCREWTGRFVGATSSADFFGLPSRPPFYVWTPSHHHHWKTLPQAILHALVEYCPRSERSVNVYEGTRVSGVKRVNGRWHLQGVTGGAAYHDRTDTGVPCSLTGDNDDDDGYDALLCTDVSSSFGEWHRASAGLPPSFAQAVRDRVGARVPLFTCLLAFDRPTGSVADAIAFDGHNDDHKRPLWFAARTNSKGFNDDDDDNDNNNNNDPLDKECWTLVSTAAYAMAQIEDEPMQDPVTGAFRPQTKEYLLGNNGPAQELEEAFLEYLSQSLSSSSSSYVPPGIIHRDAQRWGSALPARRNGSPRMIRNVPYDLPPQPLAPTTELTTTTTTTTVTETNKQTNKRETELETETKTVRSFLADDPSRLYQAGDMVASVKYTPGLEAAALSGIEVGEHILQILESSLASS